MMKNFDEREIPLSRLETSFGVITHDSDYRIVTNELGIEPTRFRQAGDQSDILPSGNIAVARYGLWEISKVSVDENPTLSEHVSYFRGLLHDKLDIIKRLREEHRFDRVFYALLNTEDSVGGFELTGEEISFVRAISDQFTYRFASNIAVDA